MTNRILNNCHVEVVGRNGVVAKAVRADTESNWYFGAVVNGKMTNIGEVYTHGPELLQRKVILAILKELSK